MKTKKLIDFLSRFDPNSRVGLLILDREKRLAFTVEELIISADKGDPMLVMALGEGEPLNEEVEI